MSRHCTRRACRCATIASVLVIARSSSARCVYGPNKCTRRPITTMRIVSQCRDGAAMNLCHDAHCSHCATARHCNCGTMRIVAIARRRNIAIVSRCALWQLREDATLQLWHDAHCGNGATARQCNCITIRTVAIARRRLTAIVSRCAFW